METGEEFHWDVFGEDIFAGLHILKEMFNGWNGFRLNKGVGLASSCDGYHEGKEMENVLCQWKSSHI